MEFLNPWLLAGAAAAAVPIVLHLIMRQRPKRFEFPALRFVRQRQAANTRSLRLRHLLLLLLRVAALCLAALALARPAVTAKGVLVKSEAPVAAALIFDTLPRMDYKHQNQTRLEAAREMGRWLLSQLPPDAGAEQNEVAILESRLDSAAFQADRAAAQDRIDRLQVTTRGQPLPVVLDEALRLLATSNRRRKEVYIFTDLSRSAWTVDVPPRLAERIKELGAAGIYVIDVGVESPQNFYLGDLSLSGQVLARNTPLVLRTELGRTGPDAGRAVEVHLLDDVGRPEKKSEETLDVLAGQAQPLSFTLAGLAVGTHHGYVRIVGEDGLGVDDTRYFTIEVKPPWPVLLAAPSPAEDYTFYLSEALAPEHFRKNDQARFRCDVAALDELATRSLTEYAAVCLVDPTPLAPDAWRRLADYAAAGHGVAFFLGRNASPTAPFNEVLAQELLPGRLASQARRPDGDTYFAPVNFQHPLLARFRPRAGNVPWDLFPVYRYWRLEELAEGVAVVAPFSDGQPALFEKPLGRGRVLTMTTPVSDPSDEGAWNLLPTGIEPWPFVMLANETLYYLVGSSDSQLNYYPGQTAVLRLDGDEAVSNYLLTSPSGEQVRGAVNASRGVIEESGLEVLGNYRVQAGGQEGLNRGFSVNLPAEASDLARMTPEELKRVLGEIEFRTARTREEIQRDRAYTETGWELFPLLIVLVAVVLGVEHVMANLFYRER